MKQEIRAIETRYKGYRFRSRLEARWAVFFDALGLDWEYEPEGFHTEAGPYLPDFKVMTPQGRPTWYEVKPKGVRGDHKFEAFSTAINLTGTIRCALLSGDPVDQLDRKEMCICPRCGFVNRPESGISYYVTETQVGCHACDFETPCGGDNAEEPGVLGITTRPHKGWIVCDPNDFRMLQAKAGFARSARFEHGETP